MTKKYDIEDEKFKSVIRSLKELPHLSAPPDFEMNLRRKLNSLEIRKDEKRRKPLFAFFPGALSLSRVLIPAGALAATVVLAFLIFNPKNSEVENPFTAAPQLRSSEQEKNAPKDNLLINPGEISSTDVVVKKNAPKALQMADRRLNTPIKDSEQMAANDRLIKRIKELNMQDDNNSGDIDRSLHEKPSPYGAGQYGNGANTVNFEGFNIYQEGDRSLDLLRARMDSIRRVMRSRR